MKTFLTIFLAAIALCSADISLPQGYNYQVISSAQSQQQAQVQLQHSPSQPQPQLVQLPFTQPSQQYLPTQKYGEQPQPQPQAPVMSLPMPSGYTGGPAQAKSVSRSNRRYRPRTKIVKKPIVTKNFFIHSAPEETEEELQAELAQLAAQPRKHYNVLFVKTPAQTSKAAALNLAKALKEEKTVVYVLAKKTSAADLQDAISEAPQQINKPEVFFIKYRTPEEAINAQRQIQSQYDSLGGTSTISDEGEAPITSVVGSLDPPEEDEIDEEQERQLEHVQASGQQGQVFEENLSQSNQYLPPNSF